MVPVKKDPGQMKKEGLCQRRESLRSSWSKNKRADPLFGQDKIKHPKAFGALRRLLLRLRRGHRIVLCSRLGPNEHLLQLFVETRQPVRLLFDMWIVTRTSVLLRLTEVICAAMLGAAATA